MNRQMVLIQQVSGKSDIYIRKLAAEKNVAVIISSHLLSEIELMCDRIGIIKNGELVATQDVRREHIFNNSNIAAS